MSSRARQTVPRCPGNVEKRCETSVADPNASYSTPEFSMWLLDYDVVNEVGRSFDKAVT